MIYRCLTILRSPYQIRFNKYFSLVFIANLIFSLSQSYGPTFWLLAYLIYFLSFGLGVGMTLHRLISHEVAQVPKSILYFFSTLGSITQVGTPVNWLLGHNLHHKYADTSRDPILPDLFGTNHLLGKFIDVDQNEYTKMLLIKSRSPILTDRFLKSLNDYFYAYTFLIYFLVYFSFGLKGLNAFLVGNLGALMATSLLTYLSHVKNLGSQTHTMPNYSVNMYGLFLIFFGEEIHNNHHAHPKRISNSESLWQIDLIGWVLRRLARRGNPAPVNPIGTHAVSN
jgi:fatty-acid desaturase